MNIIKSFFERFPFFRRTQQVREVAVNHSNVGSKPTAEANSQSPWKPDYQDNWPWPSKKSNVKFDKTNTIILTSEKTMTTLTAEQTLAVNIDDLRDTIKINAAKSSIYRHNTHKPQRNVKKRCRKLIDAANACTEKSADGKKFTIKEGKLEEYKKYMADAKELAKTLRSRRTRPFNSTLHFKRTVTLRKEQRASYIAYGFAKKKQYSEIEDNPRWKRFSSAVKPDWRKVCNILIEVYGVTPEQYTFEMKKALMEQIEVWRGN